MPNWKPHRFINEKGDEVCLLPHLRQLYRGWQSSNHRCFTNDITGAVRGLSGRLLCQLLDDCDERRIKITAGMKSDDVRRFDLAKDVMRKTLSELPDDMRLIQRLNIVIAALYLEKRLSKTPLRVAPDVQRIDNPVAYEVVDGVDKLSELKLEAV